VAVAEGQTTSEAAAAEDQKAARAFMEVIAGRDPSYAPLGTWNSDEVGGLKSFLRRVLDGIVHPAMLARSPYEALAAYLMFSTYELLGLVSELDEEDLRGRLDNLLYEGQRLVLGLPSNQEMEDAADAAAAAEAGQAPPGERS
jgi:hypothetical protein